MLLQLLKSFFSTSNKERNLSAYDSARAKVLAQEGSKAFRAKDYRSAISLYKELLSCDPYQEGVLSEIGEASYFVNNLDDAEVYLEHASIEKASNLRTLLLLANTKLRLGKINNAIQLFEKLLNKDKNHIDALNNLAQALQRQGDLDKAIRMFEQLLILKPDFRDARSNYLLALNYFHNICREDVFLKHCQWSDWHANAIHKISTHKNIPDPDRRLRIGYVSGDFRLHSVSYFIEPILKYHNRDSFEVFCYYNSSMKDQVTKSLESVGDYWREIFSLPDEEVSSLIQQDKIDLLVDLSGHTDGNRLLVFARKPAPVQITYLGYPNTTGLKAVDYRITDWFTEPEGLSEPLNCEKLLRLPEVFCCYRPDKEVETQPSSINLSGAVTYGCFNNLAKIGPRVIEVWASILKAVPHSRLLLESNGLEESEQRQALTHKFVSYGLPENCIELLPRRENQKYVLYNQLSIALDPFPCTGGTTSLDALWMGVPIVTLAGNTFVSRMGVSFLSNLELTELIAESVEDYMTIAINLGRDPNYLSRIRLGLRELLMRSPVMKAQGFVNNLEAAYRSVWQQWCSQSTSDFKLRD